MRRAVMMYTLVLCGCASIPQERHDAESPRRETVHRTESQARLAASPEQAYETAARRAHPRTLPPWLARRDASTTALARSAGFGSLQQNIAWRRDTLRNLREPRVAPNRFTDSQQRYRTFQQIHTAVYPLARQIVEAAFAHRVTGAQVYREEALRWALYLAGWPAQGATSYAAHPIECRRIAWTLALAFDWLHEEMDAAQRELLLQAILARQRDMVQDVTGDCRKLAANARDSCGGWVTLGAATAISTVLAGHVAEAREWLDATLPVYLSRATPWGEEDGGFANGSAYLLWGILESIDFWDAIQHSTGVAVYERPAMRNLAVFATMFRPPGSEAGVFGDGAEQALIPEAARVAKLLAARIDDPLLTWAASGWRGEDQAEVALLLASPNLRALAAAPEVASEALFPSVGWVAMHSDLLDPQRNSVYFKSSPFGSVSHSHADQNAFVVHSRGVALLTGSGYYDWYASPHHRRWNRATKAHNAITFDDGQGQQDLRADASGSIVAFKPGANSVVATGDATPAYGGHLSEARRTIVFVRPHIVIVHDSLRSDIARTWEWNVHSPERMQTQEAELSVRGARASACIRMLAPALSDLRLRSGFDIAPELSKRWQPHHHARFSTKTKTSLAEFIAFINIGCEPGAVPSLRSTPAGWQVSFGSRTVDLEAGRIEMR